MEFLGMGLRFLGIEKFHLSYWMGPWGQGPELMEGRVGWNQATIHRELLSLFGRHRRITPVF